MTPLRIAALILIYGFACAGWVVLGKATAFRSYEATTGLVDDVQQLWGGALVQQEPRFSVEIPGTDQSRAIMPTKNSIKVDLQADHRKKGLIWYPTFVCRFSGDYTLTNNEPVAQKVRLGFQFPGTNNTYDQFRMALDEESMNTPINVNEGISEIIEIQSGESRVFHLSYQTRGLGSWRYRPSQELGRVQGLDLQVQTDFAAVDYPSDALSPDQVTMTENSAMLSWNTPDRLSHNDMGIIIPEKLNPGPVTTRITFFAPVCLFFFFILIMTIQILYQVKIHPMHYLFVAAGFFAFHLLLSYLVGVMTIHLAFVVSGITSVFLVTGYLRAALGEGFPWRFAIAGQLFFLLLFSYSFFFKGITGLTIAIGSVVTLAILMRATAGLDWGEIFSQSKPNKPDGGGHLPPPLPEQGV